MPIEKRKTFDTPENVKCVEEAMSGMNFEKTAEEMNRATGGSLNARAAMNLTRLVGLSALRDNGRAVIVAGMGGYVDDGTLVLFVEHDVGQAAVPKI